MASPNVSSKVVKQIVPMDPRWVKFIAGYHIVIPLLLMYFLCRIWPGSAPEETGTMETISLFRGLISICVSWEVRLILIVQSTGALGSFVQGASSLVRYLGEWKLEQSYRWWYILRPFIGSALALIFYFSIRGGFLSVNAGAESISHFGMAATAGMVGLFSRYAVDKLREVFMTLFAVKEKPEEETTESTHESERENTGGKG
jgi:hypothetical protein